MLVSAKEMLQKAKAGHYAVGQFNINNLESNQGHSAHGTGTQFSCDFGRVRRRWEIYDRF